MAKNIKELIAKKAYYYFLDRGGKHGYHIQDWIKAEEDVRKELNEAGKVKKTIKKKTAKVASPAKKPATKKKTTKKATAKKAVKKRAAKKTTAKKTTKKKAAKK